MSNFNLNLSSTTPGPPAGATNIQWQQDNAGNISANYRGLALLASLTASSSSSLDFTSRNAPNQSGTIFQSDFDDYEFRVTDLIAATGGNSFQMVVGTGAGPTWDTAANYNWVRHYAQINSGFTNGSAGGGAAGAFTLFVLVSSTGALELVIRFSAPASSRNKKLHWEGVQEASDGNQYTNRGGGIYNQTTAITGVRFLISSGNITSAVIRAYGVGK